MMNELAQGHPANLGAWASMILIPMALLPPPSPPSSLGTQVLAHGGEPPTQVRGA